MPTRSAAITVSRRCSWIALCGIAACASLATFAAPREARAQINAETRWYERFAFRGEGGVAFMFPPFQRDTLHYSVGAMGAGRVGFSIIDMLAVQASFGSWYFPSDLGGGHTLPLSLGVRFEPRIASVGRLFVDANPAVEFMPDRTRFGFDVGAGFEFGIGRHIGLGPVVRYGHVFATSNDYPSDAQFLSVGVSLTIRLTPDRQPDQDDDTDGVRNREDQCPDSEPGLHPDTRRPGCPLPDRDHDNIPDESDACPDLAGSPSTDRSRNGCSGLVRLDRGELRIAENIQFAPNSDDIDPQSDEEIRQLADALRANPQIRRVSIDGHTDDVGDDDINMQLSQRRAEAVRTRLIALGIAPGRLEAHGYGETRPLVPGTSPRARATNRRVEFRIVDPAPPRR